MDIRVVRGIEVGHRIDDDARLLRAGAAIEIGEGLPAHFGAEDRKLSTDLFDV